MAGTGRGTINSMEIWKPIPGYEGIYDASNHGRIRGKGRNGKCGKIKAQRVHESAGGWQYLKVDLYKKGKRKTHRVHRLILMAFRGLPRKNQVGRHTGEDGDTFDNRPENLEWGTQQENIWDAINEGRRERQPEGLRK